MKAAAVLSNISAKSSQLSGTLKSAKNRNPPTVKQYDTEVDKYYGATSKMLGAGKGGLVGMKQIGVKKMIF